MPSTQGPLPGTSPKLRVESKVGVYREADEGRPPKMDTMDCSVTEGGGSSAEGSGLAGGSSGVAGGILSGGVAMWLGLKPSSTEGASRNLVQDAARGTTTATAKKLDRADRTSTGSCGIGLEQIPGAAAQKHQEGRGNNSQREESHGASTGGKAHGGRGEGKVVLIPQGMQEPTAAQLSVWMDSAALKVTQKGSPAVLSSPAQKVLRSGAHVDMRPRKDIAAGEHKARNNETSTEAPSNPTEALKSGTYRDSVQKGTQLGLQSLAQPGVQQEQEGAQSNSAGEIQGKAMKKDRASAQPSSQPWIDVWMQGSKGSKQLAKQNAARPPDDGTKAAEKKPGRGANPPERLIECLSEAWMSRSGHDKAASHVMDIGLGRSGTTNDLSKFEADSKKVQPRAHASEHLIKSLSERWSSLN